MPFLGIADASGIQRFLLRSPKLKKIAAASQTIEKMCLTGGLYFSTPAECLVAAGGNAVFRADTREILFHAFEAISRVLLESGDGLEVNGCIEEYAAGDLPRSYLRALRHLDCRKFSQPRSTEFVFSGLSAPGPAAPLPQADNFSLSAWRLNGHEYWEPLRLEDMICRSSEETDLVAVVSVDGIGMGKKLNAWLAGWVEDADPSAASSLEAADAEFIKEFRLWSGSLKTRWNHAWEEAVAATVGAFDGGNRFAHPYFPDRVLELRKGPQGKPFLPCRRIYQGGDDLSFVCDARLAFSLTVRLLEALNDLPAEIDVPALFGSISASAGIALVDSHFPFARAISQAEQVRQSAKVKAQETDPDHPPPALSWWVNRVGATGQLLPLFDGSSRKPYLLDSDEEDMNWRKIQETVLPCLWQTFGDSRSKFKSVLAAAEANDRGASIRRLLQQRPIRRVDGRTVSSPFAWERTSAAASSGFNGSGQTVLIDAGELYDIQFPLHFQPVLSEEKL